MITATPTLVVADVTVAATGNTADLLAVDGLRITYGRGGVLEESTPATAALTVLDRTAGATFARRTDLIGRVLRLGWSGSDGSSGTNFRGRITDVDVAPHREGGFRVSLAAASIEVDLANVVVPANTAHWFYNFGGYRDACVARIPAGLITGGVLLPTNADLGLPAALWPNVELATMGLREVDPSGKSLLELLRDMYRSISPMPMVYDPATDALRFAGRRRYAYSSSTGMTTSARLVASADHGGRYVAASLNNARHLDAHLTGYSGSLTQTMDARVTRVEIGFIDSAAGYAPATAVATTPAAADEATIGRRTLGFDSLHQIAQYAGNLASFYADVAAREATTPRLGAVSWSSAREPLHDAAHAALLLAGCESAGTVFLGRSWLTSLGRRPLVGFLGGTLTYAAGDWAAELTPAPVVVDPQPNTWAPVTVAAAALSTVKLADLDRSVTFGDAGFVDVGAGQSVTTPPHYPGNPT